MPRKNEIPEEVRAAVVQLYGEGSGYKLISKRLDVHLSTVRQIIYKWRRFNSVATRPRSGRPPGVQPGMLYELLHGEDTWSASSDDETTEDPMEQLFDSDFDGEKKIYAGSSVSMGALLLLLLTFILKHGLSKAASRDLLDLLNVVVPGCAPTSLRFLKKHLTEYKNKSEVHLYCPKCASYLGREPGVGCEMCQQSFSKEGLLEKAYYFLVMPLEIQLGNVLAHVHTKLGKHLTRDASFSDISTGSQFKRERQSGGAAEPQSGGAAGPQSGGAAESQSGGAAERQSGGATEPQSGGAAERQSGGAAERQSGGATEPQSGSITLTFKCDGSPLLKSSKFSVWTILCAINELPYAERCRNVLLHTLWFGRGKPQVQSLLTPFINECHKLWGEGLRWRDHAGSEHHTRVAARICVCDLVTMPAMQNFQPPSSEFGCGFCYHKGEVVQKGRDYTRVYPVQAFGCDLRRMAETEQLVELVLESGSDQGQMGVRGPSPLLLLPSFDLIKGFVPDYMHCFCLGVVPEFLNLWFNPLHARKPFHLSAQCLKDLDQALSAIRPPDEVGPSPRRLSDRTCWTASDWRAFGLLYSPVLLKRALPALYFQHWMLLVGALHILLSPFATQDELGAAELRLVQFVAQVPALYGPENCSFSCHLLTHLGASARDWGLAWASTAFVFHAVNSRLLQMYSGAHAQMFTRFFLYEDVIRKGGDVLQGAGAETRDFFSSLTGCHVAADSSESAGRVTPLGRGSKRFLTPEEAGALQKHPRYRRHAGAVLEYTRFIHNNMLVTTRGHSGTRGRNNSVLETSAGFVVVETAVLVSKRCSCERTPACRCQELVLLCRKLLPVQSSVSNLDVQSSVSNVDVQSSVSNVDVQSSVSNVDVQSSVSNMDVQSSVSNVDVQSSVSNVDVQSNISNMDVQSSVSNVDVQSNISNMDVQSNISNVDVQSSVSNVDVQSSVSNVDVQSSVSSVDVQSNISNMDVQSSVSNVDVQSSVSNMDVQSSVSSVDVCRFLVAVRSSEETCALTCGDILTKAFLMEQGGQLYVMRMPVFEAR